MLNKRQTCGADGGVYILVKEEENEGDGPGEEARSNYHNHVGPQLRGNCRSRDQLCN